jgi:hypothetical protein
MNRITNLMLWATFPMLAIFQESGMSWGRGIAMGYADTTIRVVVLVFLVWNLLESDWTAVFGAAVAILGLSLIALGFRWYADRKGWRQRWLRS